MAAPLQRSVQSRQTARVPGKAASGVGSGLDARPILRERAFKPAKKAAGPSRNTQTFAQQRFATQFIGGGFGGANQVFVAGADGQLGVRVVQQLLKSGFKVTAGVPDEEKARSVVDFATSVELLGKQEAQKLSLAELDLADASSIAGALPRRGARVVVVVGEGSGGGSKAARLDARAATRILLAAQQVGASQLVLVTPSGSSGGGGGGFLGGFLGGGGSGGGSGSKPSKLEQDIASSGLDFAIIRTGRTDVQDPDFEAGTNVDLGPQGSLPKQAKITKTQVARVVSQVVRLADSDVLLEAWASAEAAEIPLDEAVSQALPDAAIQDEDDGLDAEEDEEEEPDEEVEVPKTPGGLFGGFGTRKIKAGGDAPPEVAPPPSPATRGTARVKAGRPTKQQPEPASRRSRPGSRESEEEDEDADYNPTKALRGLFGRKSQNGEAEISPEKARTSAARGVKAAGRKSSKDPQERPGADDVRPKKGFLASIGFGGETSFVDDED